MIYNVNFFLIEMIIIITSFSAEVQDIVLTFEEIILKNMMHVMLKET